MKVAQNWENKTKKKKKNTWLIWENGNRLAVVQLKQESWCWWASAAQCHVFRKSGNTEMKDNIWAEISGLHKHNCAKKRADHTGPLWLDGVVSHRPLRFRGHFGGIRRDKIHGRVPRESPAVHPQRYRHRRGKRALQRRCGCCLRPSLRDHDPRP